MTPDARRGRPLSPHLQVWRFHWTMLASITHRITGVGNYFGVALLALAVVAFAFGGPDYGWAEALTAGPLSIVFWLVVFGFAVSVSYHLMNGVRHLVWDAGMGFDPDLASKISMAIFAAAVLAGIGEVAVLISWAGGA